ncbi:Protein 21.1 [Giardia lamblia P15]|uniref:Protein 21.1 n=1 Tax=Giardia intestinalis (strain P15) TaxID=658858 RepID=E1F1B5_GIAIA|nr:Protein 21.1 [Giardia lamblia P15]
MADDEWFSAAQRGNVEVIKALVAEHAGRKDDKGRTALMIAARSGQEDIVMHLIEYEKGEVDIDGSPALVHSFERDLLGICLALAPYEHSVLDAEGRSPLSIAASEGACNSVTILLQYYDGMEDRSGRTPLDYSAQSGQTRSLEILLRSNLFGKQVILDTIQRLNETSNLSLECTYLLEQELRRIETAAEQGPHKDEAALTNNLSNFPLPLCNQRVGMERDNDDNDSLLVDAFSSSQDRQSGNQSSDQLDHHLSSQQNLATEQDDEPLDEPFNRFDPIPQGNGLDSINDSTDSGLNFVLPPSLTATAEAIDEMPHIPEDLPNNCSSYSAYGTTVGISSHYTEEDLAERDFGDALSRSSNDVSSYYMTKGDGNVDDDTTGPLDFQTPKHCAGSRTQVLDSKFELGTTSVTMSLNERVLDSIMREDFKLSESEFFLRSLNISGGADIVYNATTYLKELEEGLKRLQADAVAEELSDSRQLTLRSAIIENLQSQLSVFKETTERLAGLIKKTTADLSGFQSELQSRDNLIEKLREQIFELKPAICNIADSCRDDRLTFTLHVADKDTCQLDANEQSCLSDQIKNYQKEIELLNQKLSMYVVQLTTVENLLAKQTEELSTFHNQVQQGLPQNRPTFEPIIVLERRVLELLKLNDELKSENTKFMDTLASGQKTDIESLADSANKLQRIAELEEQLSSLQQICVDYEELSARLESKSAEISCLHETLETLKNEQEEKDTVIQELKDQLAVYQRNVQSPENSETADVIKRQRDEISRLDSLLVDKNEELKVLTLRLADLEFKLTESELMRTTAKEADIDGPSKEDDATDASAVVAALQNIELTTLLRQTEASYSKLRQEHKALQKQLSDIHASEKTSSCSKCKLLMAQNTALTRENEAHRAEVTQLKYEIRACVEQITAAHATATSYKSRLGSKEREILDCQKEIDRLLRINSQLNERLLQPPRSRVSPSTRHSYSSIGSYSSYAHPVDVINQHSSTFIHNSYKPRTPSYMPSSKSSPRKSGSPQTRNILPSMITTQYAAQLSETKSYHPTMGLLPKREYDRTGPGIVPTSYVDLSIPRRNDKPSPSQAHPTARPNLYESNKRIMNASLLDALAMSGYTSENLRNAGY